MRGCSGVPAGRVPAGRVPGGADSRHWSDHMGLRVQPFSIKYNMQLYQFILLKVEISLFPAYALF